MDSDTIKINVPVLTRVEGEGALDLVIENQEIKELKLRIYEPPRYFEKLLEGRNYYDVPDAVARICGICPVAYQMSAVQAIESIFKVTATPWIQAMRRLIYCGEWLQSHSLHIHMLALPDYLGFNSIIEMSDKYAEEVRRGLKLQAIGNDLIALLGARSVHPVGVKVGGFSSAPDKANIETILRRLTDVKQEAVDLIHWLDDMEFPDDEQDFVSVALSNDHEYTFNHGRIISDKGLNIDISEFAEHFKEHQVDHSTALHCLLDGKPYLVGPLARVNLNTDKFPVVVKEVMHGMRTKFPSKNMFHSIVARAIEIYYCVIEAEKLLINYISTEQPSITFDVKSGTGFGCTEAPRGILWHRYDMDASGHVIKSVIVPPTSQNQARIEQDIKNSLEAFGLNNSSQPLRLRAEQVIRNYDPCISCATHFLTFSMLRDGVLNTAEEFIATFKHADLSKTVIIGVGTSSVGDTAGWLLIDSLSDNEKILSYIKKGLKLLRISSPATELLESVEDCDHVLILDAIESGGARPEFICIDGHKLISEGNKYSSHDMSVVDSLAILRLIKRTPKQLVVVGVTESNAEFVNKIVEMF